MTYQIFMKFVSLSKNWRHPKTATFTKQKQWFAWVRYCKAAIDTPRFDDFAHQGPLLTLMAASSMELAYTVAVAQDQLLSAFGKIVSK